MKYDQLQGLYSPPMNMESAALAVCTGNQLLKGKVMLELGYHTREFQHYKPAGPLELRRTSDLDGEKTKADLPKIPETRVTTTPDARTWTGLLSR